MSMNNYGLGLHLKKLKVEFITPINHFVTCHKIKKQCSHEGEKFIMYMHVFGDKKMTLKAHVSLNYTTTT